MKFYKTPTQKYRLYLIKKILKNKRKGQFLDIGCGLGFVTASLLKMGFLGQGIDPSLKSIRLARKLHPQIKNHFILKSLSQLSPHKQYDLIVMAEVLEHLKNDQEVLRKVNAILKKGGILILTVPAHKKAWNANDEFAGHRRRYEKKGLQDKLKRSGFKVEKIHSFGFPFFNLTTRIALKIKSESTPLGHHSPRQEPNLQNRSENSAHTRFREKAIQKSNFLFNPVFIRPLFVFQNLFFKTDLGQNYIVLAKKNNSRDH